MNIPKARLRLHNQLHTSFTMMVVSFVNHRDLSSVPDFSFSAMESYKKEIFIAKISRFMVVPSIKLTLNP